MLASPWFVRNWLWFGNPMYPFAGNLFPTPGWSEFNQLFFTYHAGMKGSLTAVLQAPIHMKILDLISLPFRLTFFPGDRAHGHPEDFGAWPIGAIWLVGLLFLVFYRNWDWRGRWHLIFGGFLYLVWAYTYRDTRFLLPALVVFAPVLAGVIEQLASRWRSVQGIVFVLLGYSLLYSTALTLIPPTYAPWWVISGVESEREYLASTSDFTCTECQAFFFLEKNAAPEDIVLLHGIEQTFYCPNPYIGADWFNTDPLITVH